MVKRQRKAQHGEVTSKMYSLMAKKLLGLAGILCVLAGCTTIKDPLDPAKSQGAKIQIHLNQSKPNESFANINTKVGNEIFKVGFGKYGVSCKGSQFEEGMTPLGTFKVNAILSNEKFEMEESLINKSGKGKEYLVKNLFNNMSSIDFQGDGRKNEYGMGYISLKPVPENKQPFEFNEYAGKFRWYSFAIHGTNDERRVGKAVTGGCINMNNKDITKLLKEMKLGDQVVITTNGACTNT